MLTEFDVGLPGQVICDGEPLTLPDDIEGVLFLNINSYMGGVDLWASGVDSTGSGRTGKQSLCDGKLEVLSPSALLFGVCCELQGSNTSVSLQAGGAVTLCIACSSQCPLHIAEKQRSSHWPYPYLPDNITLCSSGTGVKRFWRNERFHLSAAETQRDVVKKVRVWR